MNQERKFAGRSQTLALISKTEKRTAELIGQTAGNAFVDLLRNRVRSFDLQTTGQENIEDLQCQPFILVANHVKTKGLVLGERDLNITPDAFILERAVEELTQRHPQIVASSDFGFQWHENPASKIIQKKVETWRDQVLTGAGFIPIKRGDSRVNLKFFRQVRVALAQNTPIIIFPEGNSYWGHEPETPLKEGVAKLAKRNSVPIVPARIDGATSWSPKSPVIVNFKEPVMPDESIEEIMGSIRSGISAR